MALFGTRSSAPDLRQQTASFVHTLYVEPPDADVRWLADTAGGGDADHARWEWRYARRALGLLVAQRDALDDRTPSLVAHALSDDLARDPHIAVGMLPLAERQFNERLAAYRDALTSRGAESASARVARILLAFTGTIRPRPEHLDHAATLMARVLSDVSTALAHAFGTPPLSE